MKYMIKGSDIVHDYENCRYIAKNRIIKLTPYENIVLGFMIANKGKLVVPYIVKNRINITRLKDKLKNEINIIAKWGIGYYIDC